MRGIDLKEWRQRNRYTQEALMHELGVRSRQTMISWERSDKLPRIVELAIQALERSPDLRTVAGERCPVWTSVRLGR
jgi:DNA-binding XRE family transcriptional regulator